MPLDPTTLSKTMRKLNPQLTNPATRYTPADEGLVMARPKLKPTKKLVAKIDYAVLLFPFLEANGLRLPEREFLFNPPRLWRFDFAWTWGVSCVRGGVALEIQGGAFKQGGGGHNRGAAYVRDIYRLSVAASLGWFVIQRTPKDLLTMETVRLLKGAMQL